MLCVWSRVFWSLGRLASVAPTSGSSAPASFRPRAAVPSPAGRGTAGRRQRVPTARGGAGRRRLRPLPCPLPGPRGLSAAAWDSRPRGCGCSRRPPQRPRRRHGPRGLAASARAGRRMPVDAHLLPEFLLPGPARAAGENVRGRGGTQGLRVSEVPGLLLLSSLPRKPRGAACSGDAKCSPSPERERALLPRHVAPSPAQVLLQAPLWTPQAPRGSPDEHPAGPTTPGAHAQRPWELESS